MMLAIKRARVKTLAAGVLAIVAISVAGIGWQTHRALRISSEEVRSEHEIAFVSRSLGRPVETNFEPVSAPAVFLQAAAFQGHLYIASPAGLMEYDPNGTPLRKFMVGRELPGSPLIALTEAAMADAHEPELVIATQQDGLLAFNGQKFRQIYPKEADFRAITSILPVGAGHLLIGNIKRGVLLYDGKKFSPLHPTLSRLYVQTLAGDETDLWVGTLNQGVLHWHAGETETFGEEQGLPDSQVQTITRAGEKTYVGTVMGVAEFDGSRFSRVLARGVLATSLLVRGENLIVGSEDQGILTIPLTGRHPNASSNETSQLSEVRQFFSSGETVYALTRSALYEMNARGFGWREVLQPDATVLSDRNISALAADESGRLWVGYFDRGLDILQRDSSRVTHVENERVFCINRIWPEAKTGTVSVATANGLVRFGASGKQEQVLTRADGLIADHVTDVAPYRDGMAIATPAGLTFLDASGARSMYTFHGLVNNHVYALGVSGDDLLVGTLGGLSAINKGDVQANYTAGGSGLKHNWITAVVPVGDEWMVGTYGAGVLGMNRAGHFQSFEKATADVEINPNAMLVTQGHVFAGTLGNGLYIYDRTTRRWTAVSEGLPSTNVTALAESNGYIYVGTDNGLVRIQEQKLSR
jgi:ligand-binding sensor domain-containing protein